jgi:hypothetical protein
MLIAAFALQAQSAVFAPPLGVPIRVVAERTQGEGDKRRTTRIERLVRFARDGQGYRAEVVLLHAETGAQEGANAMLGAGFAGLAGKPMAFRLDGAGKVIEVENRQALWDMFCASVAKIVLDRRGRVTRTEQAAFAERIAAPLRALPPERQQAMLASLVTVLISEDAGDLPGTRDVRIPGVSPFGGPIGLTGTRTISVAGLITHRTTRAAADVPGQGSAAGRVEIEIDRDTDPRTGLIASADETLRTTIGEGAAAQRSERVSTVRVTIEPDRAWPR